MGNIVWKSALKKSLSALKPIGTTLAYSPWLVVLYWWVSDFSIKLSLDDRNIIGDFIEWFGTAYSLFLALVLANAWNQFDKLDREFDQELDAITTLYDSVKYAQDPARQQDAISDEITGIDNSIKNYVKHVIDNYRDEDKFIQQRRNGNLILEGIGRRISSLARLGEVADSLISELFRSLNVAIDVRSDRISHSKQRIPKTVWLVAVVSSVLWLLPFLALKIDDDHVKVMLKVGVAFVIVIVLTIIADLDSPYEGTWKIDLESWEEFFDIVTFSPQVLFVFNVNSGVVDQLKNLIGVNLCKLSALSRSGFMGLSWRRFLKRIEYKNPLKKVKCVSVYADQFTNFGYASRITVEELPCVILISGDNFYKLLDVHDINDCPDLSKFEDLFVEKLREQIEW